MLIITRRNGESFQIGKDIRVVVLKTTNNLVKIAIEAPKEYSIVRSELIEVQDENKEAAKHSNNVTDIFSSLNQNIK